MRILLAIALATWLVAVVPGAAQNNETLRYRIDIDKNDNGENKVFAAFRDHEGQPALYVTVQFKVRRVADGQEADDVDPADIIVREDGHKVHELEIFSPRAALTTVLALDISGSMENPSGVSGIKKIDEAKKAADIFLDNLSVKSETGLILFDHKMRLQSPPLRQSARYAEHRRQVRAAIAAAQPLGGTAYLDAAAASVAMLKNIDGRRAVVLMTDGVDMNSKATVKEVIKLATVNQVPIYTLGIGELGKYKNVTTVLVLDHSGSMKEKADANDRRSKIAALRTAASRFVELMRRDAKTTLQRFSSEVDVPDNFSDDKQLLIEHIGQLQPTGGTLLYDAAYAGLETLAAAGRVGRNAVVVLTDGRDEAPGSRVSAQLVVDRAKELGFPLYMLGLGQANEINETVMKRMAAETGGKYFHAGSEQRLFEIFEKLSIDLHDDGINEKELRELADKTGGKFFWARDASKLPEFFRDLASQLQSTYTVTFASRRSSHDGTARGIDISIERGGVRFSNVGSADYNVHGVVVPEMDYRIYLGLLAFLSVFLLAPMGVRQLYRFYGGS